MQVKFETKLLTIEEVALLLNRSKSAVYAMVSRGQLPYIKLGTGKNGAVRFEIEEIKAFIENRKVGALPPVKKGVMNA